MLVPPDAVGVEAFAVIRDAMVGKGVAALGRVVMNKRERVIAIEPFEKGLIGTALHYPYEVRKAADYFGEIPDVKIQPEMLKLAEHIVEQKLGDFQPDLFVDHYEHALIEVLRKKKAHIPLKKSTDKPSAPTNVVNLMDALRRSLSTASARAPKPAKGKKKAATGQKEMLLPITGKKPTAAKETAKTTTRRKAG